MQESFMVTILATHGLDSQSDFRNKVNLVFSILIKSRSYNLIYFKCSEALQRSVHEVQSKEDTKSLTLYIHSTSVYM